MGFRWGLTSISGEISDLPKLSSLMSTYKVYSKKMNLAIPSDQEK